MKDVDKEENTLKREQRLTQRAYDDMLPHVTDHFLLMRTMVNPT